MAYKSRSKYTPGGGVLAFFELVSRFVSLSVLGWVSASLFFILFVADGKVTDSFDLRLVRGVFSDLRLTWTALVLLALSGVVGGLLSLPSAVVLFLTRQYLDFHIARSSRKAGLIRIKIIRSLPVVVLLICHFTAVSVSLISAPQLTRAWFEQNSRLSASLTGIHFVISSLTRKSFETENGNAGKAKANDSAGPVGSDGKRRHIQIFFLPADILESDEFRTEQSKLKDAQRIRYIISKSVLSEQIEELFAGGQGKASVLVKKVVRTPSQYGRVQREKETSALVSLSSQLRFGRSLFGRGTDSVAQIADEILAHESQRRLVASQVHLFGIIRLFEGLPFAGRQIGWLDLLADDVMQIRTAAAKDMAQRSSQKSVSIIQLSGLEKNFDNVNVPFKPTGWPEKISHNEKKLVIKNTLRELSQYIHDFSSHPDILWAVLPYADDKRISPRSVAFVKPDISLPEEFRVGSDSYFGVMNSEMGKFLREFLGESGSGGQIDFVSERIPAAKPKPDRIRCYESEIDLDADAFVLQSTDSRQQSLGHLLNFLPQLPKRDLEFLGRGTLQLLARDSGFGFVCKAKAQADEMIYLIKPDSGSEMSKTERKELSGASILVSPAISGKDVHHMIPRQRNSSPAGGGGVAGKTDNNAFKGEILSDFRVLGFTQQNDAASAVYASRVFDRRESQEFFAKFEPEALQAFEVFARARIR